MQEFRDKIKHRDAEGNHTYLWAKVDGCTYGQSYPNTVNTLEGMYDRFTVFYYKLYQEDCIRREQEKQMTDRERADYQNMCVARVKAIAIMEFLEDKKIKDGEEWYAYEDKIVEIIERD